MSPEDYALLESLRAALKPLNVEPTGVGQVRAQFPTWPLGYHVDEMALLFVAIVKDPNHPPIVQGWALVELVDGIASYYRRVTSSSEPVPDVGKEHVGRIVTGRRIVTEGWVH